MLRELSNLPPDDEVKVCRILHIGARQGCLTATAMVLAAASSALLADPARHHAGHAVGCRGAIPQL